MSAFPLQDTFGRHHSYLRISVTDRCNLRCTYCMPEHGLEWTPPAKLLTTDEIVRLARIFVDLGVRKIRLTGGEPLTRPSIGDIAIQLKQLKSLDILAMTTNGIGLVRWAAPLHQAGLDSITVSLDTLQEEKFLRITKRDRFTDVIKGLDTALSVGFKSVKLNIVVMQGINDDELLDFVAFAKDRPLSLRFIEYMPFAENNWSRTGVVPYATMRDRIGEQYELIPMMNAPSAVGKEYALTGHAASVSFISSMTESFCSTCNRLRLTADGNIKSCLFSSEEYGLRDVLRAGASDGEIVAVIQTAVAAKANAHAPMDDLPALKNRSMVAIGG